MAPNAALRPLVVPTVPASLAVLVNPGSLTALATVDGTAYGSLAADTASALVKMGVNLEPTQFTVPVPAETCRYWSS